MKEKKQIAYPGILLLAAGSSTRMGTPKQLLPFGGSTLLGRAAETALSAGAVATIVVLGTGDTRMREGLRGLPVDIFFNEHAGEGMAGSLAGGLRQLTTAHPEADGVLVMVCDQPFVSRAHLRALIDAQNRSGKRIAFSRYGLSGGVPALFHRDLFDALLRITGDRGAKRLINQYPEDSIPVSFPLGVVDIDTPEAYETALRTRSQDTEAPGAASPATLFENEKRP